MMPTLLPRLGLLSLFCLLGACQTFKDGDQRLYEQSERLFEESLEQSQNKVAPPPSVQAALIPPLDIAGSSGVGPRFDVAVNDMPARDFFLSLMQSAGQNLLVHPEVTGNITFSLSNVNLEEVLAAVRDSYGYDYRRTSYGYQIQPNQAITRTYDLNYLNVQRLGTTDTRVSSGQVTSSDNTGVGVGGTTTSSTSSTVNASQLLTSSNVDFWAEIREVIAMMIGAEEGNQVVVNPQAGLLVVRAASADQQAVENFLRQAQRNLQRQVILETKILEVNLSDGFQAGINWSFLQGQKGISLGGFATTAGGVNIPNIPLEGPDGIGGVFGATFDFGNFEGVVQLLETQGDVRVLSSPRISTLNNQKAVIKVGTDEFFVTDVSTTTTSLAGGTTAPDLDITLTPFFSGISLDVTPQIDENDQITLHVRPTVSRVQDQNKSIQLGSADNVFNLPLALSTTRQSDSIVRARSGQVVVIGGLLENRNSNDDANVPWLSKLPFAGALFQQQRKSLEQTELVILMRPQVVNDQVWLDELRKSSESFRSTR
ncbi:pilus (MSHA type) biogenesis protein MshL [Stutzerimonas nitrititolerans]|uniref:pilus (MSHA type) biogenesis protein MshL n=1 Tax=Stutzerimonas nitrititolerans TaxID=2482751 RepID=UPI000F7AEFFC|nr:pilus (MSHA type) biogenesis protein MshL [Stutzerimonas nitrititolerans]MBA1234383.1 pilus (MSHA type) biogenesis protein MshL [Stutzerimonas stutzeri]RRV21190.1 pilus (MSHA type) biogenesis protein MshL [Pseudomonas sp. s199]